MGIGSKAEHAIADAYIELLEEHPFDEIRVHEIIERAGVGKSTFYRHFDSASAVLEKIEDDLYAAFPLNRSTALGLIGTEQERIVAVREACHRLQGFGPAFKALVGPNGDFAFRRRMEKRNDEVMHALIARSGSRPDEALSPEQELLVHGVAGMRWGVLTWWAEHQDEVSVNMLADALLKQQEALCALIADTRKGTRPAPYGASHTGTK